jgi:hypothetical protein
MDNATIEGITEILTEYAKTKFSSQALEVKGPIQEGSAYRWRIVSTRYKDVTVLLRTRKLPFSKPTMTGIEVYGSSGTRKLQPTLQDLRDYLEKAELVPVR